MTKQNGKRFYPALKSRKMEWAEKGRSKLSGACGGQWLWGLLHTETRLFSESTHPKLDCGFETPHEKICNPSPSAMHCQPNLMQGLYRSKNLRYSVLLHICRYVVVVVVKNHHVLLSSTREKGRIKCRVSFASSSLPRLKKWQGRKRTIKYILSFPPPIPSNTYFYFLSVELAT